MEKTSVILTCPSCSAQYFADDKAIGENGRTVRCAACSHSWFVKPELSLEEELNASDLSREKVERARHTGESREDQPHLAYREKEMAKRENGSRLAAISAWAGSAAIFFGLGVGAVVNRDQVVKLWPEASSAYAMAGLETNRFGLEFGEINAERKFEGTTPVLEIEGSVFNITQKYQAVPVIKVDLRDDHGQELESILVTMNSDILGPGESGVFQSRLDTPPLEAFDMSMSFIEPENVGARMASIAGQHHADEENAEADQTDSHGPDDHDTQQAHDADASDDHH